MVDEIRKENAQKIAVEHIRKRKKADRVDVANVEQDDSGWIVRGTCPIDMEGHPWIERFEIVIDLKGKIKSEYSTLL